MKRFSLILVTVLTLSNVVFGQTLVIEKVMEAKVKNANSPGPGMTASQLFEIDEVKKITDPGDCHARDSLAKKLFDIQQFDFQPPRQWSSMLASPGLGDDDLLGDVKHIETGVLAITLDGYNKGELIAVDSDEDFLLLLWDMQLLANAATQTEPRYLSEIPQVARM